MNIDEDQIDDVVLALLQLTAHCDAYATRAWKGQSWEVMERLHKKGWISDPKGKTKSVGFTEEGLLRSQMLFDLLFHKEAEAEVSTKKTEKGVEGILIRISLRDSDPEIWRELCIPDDLTLGELHRVIQVVMGWENYHLHQFNYKKQIIGEPSDDDWQEVLDENEYKVSSIFRRKGSRIEYEYDFGDGWVHDVVSLGKAKKDEPLFHVTGGAMACPPEDCGGIWGYVHLLEALADRKHPEHQDLKSWVGEGFDPKAFDRDPVNQILRTIVKPSDFPRA